MKKLLLSILLCTSSFSYAGNFDILLHVKSWHSAGEFNERNTGIGVVYNQSKGTSYAVGVYRNSLNNTSAYALIQYLPIEYKALQAGIFAGAISGYPNANIAAGALLKINTGDYYHQFQIVPKVQGVTPAVVGYSLGFKF